jgi:hypothetical protein
MDHGNVKKFRFDLPAIIKGDIPLRAKYKNER